MEVFLINPKNSFVQFTAVDAPPVDNPGCCSEPFCLPIIDENDWFFQFRINVPDLHTACEMIADPDSIQLIMLRGNNNDATTSIDPANILRNFTAQDNLHFRAAITGDLEVTFYWGEPLLAFDQYVGCYQCFQLALIIQGAGGTGKDATHISNCFVRECAECDYSIVDYMCEEDSYDFRYCQFDPPVPNRARLPFYFEEPQPITDKSVYPRSDGSWLITKAVTREEWSAVVDAIPKDPHFYFAIALEHDDVLIETSAYTGGFRSSSPYTIAWPKIRKVCVGPATFKGNATPYDARNNNCNVCDDLDENACADTAACGGDVDGEYALTTDGGGAPLIHVTWTNPLGIPAVGYSVNIGSSSGGIPSGFWGTESPISLAQSPPGSGIFAHDFGYSSLFHGELAIRITTHCNDTTTHETILIVTIP